MPETVNKNPTSNPTDFKYGSKPAPPPTPDERKAIVKVSDYIVFCRNEYAIPDHVAELVASILVPCPSHKPLWTVFDSARHPFWTDLGRAMELLGYESLIDVALVKAAGIGESWTIANEVDKWLRLRDRPRIMIDTTGHSRIALRGISAHHYYWRLASECVRIPITLTATHLPHDQAHIELANWLKFLADPHRTIFPSPVPLPDSLMAYTQWSSSWNREVQPGPALYDALRLLPSSHAALYGRTSPNWYDWQPVKLLCQGMFKRWFHPVIQYFSHMARDYEPGSKSWIGALPAHHTLAHIGIEDRNIDRHLWELIRMGLIRRRRMQDKTKKRYFGRDKSHRYDLTPLGHSIRRLLYSDYFDVRSGFQPFIDELRHEKSKNLLDSAHAPDDETEED